jgi:tryptophanyl-tRNA synthetase
MIDLGNYNSVIKNWIELQNKYTCFFFIADIHALTTNFDNIDKISENTHSIIIELLALGLDPNKCNIFIQSYIPEIFELQIIISMMIKVARLERIPSYKDEKNLNNRTYGFLGYPILQAADVLCLNSHYIPVGQDQIPHIELIKEIARKINNSILKNNPFQINEPEALLYKKSKILGIDGLKMSKSKNNAIFISDTGPSLKKKIIKFVTDPNRIYRHQKGNPEICPVWSLHDIYSDNEQKQIIKYSCENAKIDCTKCKETLYLEINKENEKFTTKIKEIKNSESYIQQIIKDGNAKTILESRKMLNNIKKSFKI